ncbi:MAG: hypothetical protein Tsb002_25750 [Wenzhouxiangellaceae bacterium]
MSNDCVGTFVTAADADARVGVLTADSSRPVVRIAKEMQDDVFMIESPFIYHEVLDGSHACEPLKY